MNNYDPSLNKTYVLVGGRYNVKHGTATDLPDCKDGQHAIHIEGRSAVDVGRWWLGEGGATLIMSLEELHDMIGALLKIQTECELEEGREVDDEW